MYGTKAKIDAIKEKLNAIPPADPLLEYLDYMWAASGYKLAQEILDILEGTHSE